jgi:hypothetical protein
METTMKRIYLPAALAAALIGQPAQASLVALYEFNDASNLGRDTSGNNNHATNSGAGYTAAGYQGGAATFNFNAFLRAGVDVGGSALPNMTWGAWVRPAVGGGDIQAVLSNDNGGFDRQIGIDNRGGVSSWSAFTGSNVFNPGVAPSTSAWTFLAAVYKQGESAMTLYVNGQAYNISTSFGASAADFTIGRNATFHSHFSGLIDNVFVYNQAFSADQIGTLRSTGFPTAQAPVAAVPEPGTWAMMILGFGAVGFSVRRGRRDKTLAQLA